MKRTVDHEDRLSWSLIRKAGRDTHDATHALGSLCQAFVFPMYTYARCRSCPSETAPQLVDEFIGHLLAYVWTRGIARNHHRLRPFLRVALHDFIESNHIATSSFTAPGLEQRYQRERCHHLTAERQFSVCWAKTLQSQAVEEVAAEYERAGLEPVFIALQSFLTGHDPDAETTARLCHQFHWSRSAFSLQLHALRRRYRVRFRERIATTVGSVSALTAEQSHLYLMLGSLRFRG